MTSLCERSRCGRHGAGFTLFELLIVMAVLALVIGFGVMGARPGSPGAATRAAAAEVASSLRMARAQAIASNKPVAVTIDLVSREYRVGGGTVQRLPASVALKLLTASEQQVNDRVGRIRFEPDGSSTGGRMTLTGGGRSLAVGVDWLSGRVSVAAVSKEG